MVELTAGLVTIDEGAEENGRFLSLGGAEMKQTLSDFCGNLARG